MIAIGVMAMPVNFRYREVLIKGKPQHDTFDPFRIRHPAMNHGHARTKTTMLMVKKAVIRLSMESATMWIPRQNIRY